MRAPYLPQPIRPRASGTNIQDHNLRSSAVFYEGGKISLNCVAETMKLSTTTTKTTTKQLFDPKQMLGEEILSEHLECA